MTPSSDRLDRTIQRIVEMEMLRQLMELAVNDRAYDEVKAWVINNIKEIKLYANNRNDRKTNDDGIYYRYVVKLIERFMEKPEEFKIPDSIQAPDGSPIGSCDF